MVAHSQQQDWREKQYTSGELKSIYLVGGGIMIGLLGVFIGAVLFAGDDPLIHDVTGYWMNISTQIVSIIVIILGVNWLSERREIRRLKGNDREMFSKTSLQSAKLEGADLTGAGLWNANLEDANLESANLHSASLLGSKLQRAHLHNVNLIKADLSYVNLFEADLTAANLELTLLIDTNLQGSLLWCANLKNAGFILLNLENAIMPNGEVWHDGMDLEIFTNPDHPNFWRSDDPFSPAYRGDED